MGTGFRIVPEHLHETVAVTVFHLHGWLDAQSEGQLLGAARDAYTAGARYLLIDLSEIDTLTSAGMRAIQKVYRIFTGEEDQFKVARVKICNAPPQIFRVLGVTGFLQNIPAYESVRAALDSFVE